jgi:hypothetical protein
MDSYGKTYTFAHNLGQRPSEVDVYAVCTSNDVGYTAGEYINISPWGDKEGGIFRGFAVETDATNVYLHVADDGIGVIRADNQAWDVLSVNDWSLGLAASLRRPI